MLIIKLRTIGLLGALAALLVLPANSRGQAAGSDNLLLTVATTTDHAAGSKWVYIAWLSSNPQLLSQHAFAVYRKAGAANAAAPYQRVAIVAPQTDARNVRALLLRAAAMGLDNNQLEATINDSFSVILPGNSPLLLEEKIAALISGARDSPEVTENLTLLAQRHPAINLCRGHAHAEPIPVGLTTFEIRQVELGSFRELGVIGRVTVDGAADPLALPAPGAPVEVPLDREDKFDQLTDQRNDQMNSYRDQLAQRELNLAARIRWAAPPALLRVSALQAGFNLYRVTRQHAEAQGWHQEQNPPSAAQLSQLNAAQGGMANNLPILTDADLTVEQAADLSDKKTAFFTDDRDGPLGGVPFNNGDQFYYFVTARDLLGRDGLVSPGKLVTILDHFGALPPRDLRLENVYHRNDAVPQRLRLRWSPPVNPVAGASVGYYVYRWRNVDEIFAQPGDPTYGRLNATAVGAQLLEYIDLGVGPADVNKKWFYTVRAEYSTPTHGADHVTLTAHSAPAFGVLRDRLGPGAPNNAVLSVKCAEPSCVFDRNVVTQDANDPEMEKREVQLFCQAASPGLEYAEFSSGSTLLGRVNFVGGLAALQLQYTPGQIVALDSGIEKILCEVTARGATATASRQWAIVIPGNATAPGLSNATKIEVFFDADLALIDCPVPANGEPPDGFVPGINGRTVNFTTATGTLEWKLYRRIDDGPIVYLARGETGSEAPIAVVFEDLGNVYGFVCYFVQLFDRHGNPSRFVEVACLDLPTATMPIPSLTPLTATGSETNRTIRVSWFCPPHGVDHFELLLARKGDDNPPTSFGNELSTNLVAGGVGIDGVEIAGLENQPWGVYRTHRIRGRLSGGQIEPLPSVFNIDLDVEPGTYYATVKAVSGRGQNAVRSVISNIEQASWVVTPKVVGPQVPWPARPLPPVHAATSFSTKIVAGRLAGNFQGNTIRIGELKIGSVAGNSLQQMTAGPAGFAFGFQYDLELDPNTGLYTRGGQVGGNTLFPCVLYRYRVPPGAEDNPASGSQTDIVQVSPLLQGIAYRSLNDPLPRTEVPDPYIILEGKNVTDELSPDTDILLVDRHPVIRGAQYRYLITRFDPRTREIDAIYYTNVTTPIP